MPLMSNVRLHMPATGDLLLFRHTARKKSVNVLGQAIARLRRIDICHVAIAYGQHTMADAQPAVGIAPYAIQDVLAGLPRDSYRVLRNRVLANDPELQHSVRLYIHDSVGGKYNWFFLLYEHEHGAFCSEYAARIYNHIGLGFASDTAAYVLPGDLARLFKRSDWCDVTKEYIAYLSPKRYPSVSTVAVAEVLGKSDVVLRRAQIRAELVQLESSHFVNRAARLRKSRWARSLSMRSAKR